MKTDYYEATRGKAEVLDCGLKVLKTESGTLQTKYCLQIWRPKALKPYANYYFKTEAERDAYIQNAVKCHESSLKLKAEHKAARMGTQEQIDAVKIGDIFHFSWGYEQTNCDFFQVVAKRGKMVDIKAINAKSTEQSTGNSMSDYRLPEKDAFVDDQTTTKRLQFSEGTPYLNMASYGYCSLWDGEKCYCSWYA